MAAMSLLSNDVSHWPAITMGITGAMTFVVAFGAGKLTMRASEAPAAKVAIGKATQSSGGISLDKFNMGIHLKRQARMLAWPSDRRMTFNKPSVLGFTLLEILVALAVLGVVLLAMSRVSQTLLMPSHDAATRILAQRVALNEIATLRLTGQYPEPAETRYPCSEGGMDFECILRIEATQTRVARQIQVGVATREGITIAQLETVLVQPTQLGGRP